MIDSFQEDIKVLQSLSLNLKKSINKNFKVETLQAKLQYANALYSHIEDNLVEHESSLTSSELNFLVKAARSTIIEIRNIIKIKIDGKIEKGNNPKSEEKMSNPATAFDIRQATALIQPYDGNVTGLDTFVDSANLLKELTPEAQLPMALRFIKTRLSGKARTGLPENINNIDVLIQNIRARCADTTTPDSIVSKLNATKQRGTITNYCEEIENLCLKLENSYIAQQIPINVAKSMATKAGLNALIGGINNNETKVILKAGTFPTIKEALQKVQENVTENTNAAQILTTRFQQLNQNTRRYPQNNFRRGNRNQNFHRRNPQNFQQSGPHSHYNHTSNFESSRFNNFSYRGRGRGNTNYSSQPTRWAGNRNKIYIANTEPDGAAQQDQILLTPTNLPAAARAMQPEQIAPLTQLTQRQRQQNQDHFLGPMY